MRKRVTFVEHMKKENLLKNGGGHIFMRSAESNKRPKDGLECLPGLQVRKTHRGSQVGVSQGSRHAAGSVMATPFLQHPAPAPAAGQRRHLCSAAGVYSAEKLRRQMKQHYLTALHACVQSGRSATCRRRCGHHRRGDDGGAAAEDAGKEPEGRRRGGGGRGGGGGAARSDVTLPKIVKR